MKITFHKYHGTGNDFIMIDDRLNNFPLSTEQVRKLCDRHFGIGGDGLIRIVKKDGFDFEMVYYNSDGNFGSMCGNGGRCAVAFAHTLKLIKEETNFLAFDGPHEAILVSKTPLIVKLKMADVLGIQKVKGAIVLNTGSPHYVTFVKSVKEVNVESKGKAIRNSDDYKAEGINVNFVQIEDNSIHVRTYERGVEGETLSCGTGVTAAVIAAVYSGKIKKNDECVVHTPGGKLKVHFNRDGQRFDQIWLEGPAVAAFSGNVIV
ncbi:MAG: diaminopimelate epimerase [Bacteroidetes bacterium]|nr:diaminopimelate epimerase [Bacteroidota bacterium]